MGHLNKAVLPLHAAAGSVTTQIMTIHVAVSGVTGFIGSHIGRDLLRKGYFVHGTVRSNKPERIAHLTSEPSAAGNLKIFEADLNTPGAFDEAVKGCKYAIHVASPVVMNVKDPQKELVDPAVNGTLSFLRSCKVAGVEKVVLTSSVGAITDEGRANYTFTEKDFNTNSSLTRMPYCLSKVKAERAAWDFVKKEAPEMKLVVINPFLVIGPSLTKSTAESTELILNIASGVFFGIVDMLWTFVDVRDVSLCHILAMESDKAEGRYICAASDKTLHLKEVSEILRAKGYDPPMRNLAGPWITALLKTLSYVFPGQRGYFIRNYLGNHCVTSNAKIVKDLGVSFRDPVTAVEDTITDLVKWGHLHSAN